MNLVALVCWESHAARPVVGRAGNGKLGAVSKSEMHIPFPGCVVEVRVLWLVNSLFFLTDRENCRMENLKPKCSIGYTQ